MLWRWASFAQRLLRELETQPRWDSISSLLDLGVRAPVVEHPGLRLASHVIAFVFILFIPDSSMLEPLSSTMEYLGAGIGAAMESSTMVTGANM
jgi:hypothetical protein